MGEVESPSLVSVTICLHSLSNKTQVMNPSHPPLPSTGNTAHASLQLSQHRRKSQILPGRKHFLAVHASPNRPQHLPITASIHQPAAAVSPPLRFFRSSLCLSLGFWRAGVLASLRITLCHQARVSESSGESPSGQGTVTCYCSIPSAGSF